MKQFYSLCMIMLLASVLAIDVMGQKTTLTVTGKVTDLEGKAVCRIYKDGTVKQMRKEDSHV